MQRALNDDCRQLHEAMAQESFMFAKLAAMMVRTSPNTQRRFSGTRFDPLRLPSCCENHLLITTSIDYCSPQSIYARTAFDGAPPAAWKEKACLYYALHGREDR